MAERASAYMETETHSGGNKQPHRLQFFHSLRSEKHFCTIRGEIRASADDSWDNS